MKAKTRQAISALGCGSAARMRPPSEGKNLKSAKNHGNFITAHI